MTAEECLDKWHDLLFGVRRSVRYHMRRRGVFERVGTIKNALNLVFGSVTIYGVLSHFGPEIPVATAALVSILSALDLVIGSARMARLYHDLARRFIELERRMEMEGVEAVDARRIADWTRERLAIEAEEPPVLRVLDTLCYNELARAMGYGQKHQAKVGFFQRLFAQVYDVRQDTLTTCNQDAFR